MCSFLWVTWPKLIIFENTYIWTMCSFKRKLHAIRLNFVKNKTRILYQQKTIEANWHNIFDYANFEILFNFKKTIENIKIIILKSISIINLCEICAFTKIYKLIFRRSDHDESINAFFEKTKFDLIQQISNYNKNN